HYSIPEARRQPVEQFWVRRAVAVEAEVVGGGDQAAAEVVVPDAVHDDAGGERVGGVDDPVGQASAAFGFGGVGGEAEVRGGRADDGETAGGHPVAAALDVAPQEEVGRLRRARVGGIGHGRRRDRLQRLLLARDLGGQLVPLAALLV